MSKITLLVVELSLQEAPSMREVELSSLGAYMLGRKISNYSFILFNEFTGEYLQVSANQLSSDVFKMQQQFNLFAEAIN